MLDFMRKPLDHAAANAPPWLADIVSAGRMRWEASSMPTRKTEQWKYTSLQHLQGSYAPANDGRVELAEAGLELPDLGGFRLVFVNGHFSPESSDTELPEGVNLVRFADASDSQAETIREHLGLAVGRDQPLFTALNEAALEEGVFLDIDPDISVEQPLIIAWLTANQDQAFGVSQRMLVMAGRGSHATVIEYFDSASGGQDSFTNGVTELLLNESATLNHCRLHLEQANAVHIGRVHAQLSSHATLKSFHCALGSVMKRLDLVVDHVGEGAHSELNGVYLPREREHIDYHTCTEHRVPNCSSSEIFRGIIEDEASAVFNGRIHIHENAQKTRAELNNRNLLTSAQAEVNTKPELEIYADDVQCAHGATVAQLDLESLHYLRSRGIARDEATVMLSFGFINEVIDSVSCEAVAEHLRGLLSERFAKDPALRAHRI
ncbi:MAG: Fe-S cluster assembly protein SufD [Pseudomonadota bacterium]